MWKLYYFRLDLNIHNDVSENFQLEYKEVDITTLKKIN